MINRYFFTALLISLFLWAGAYQVAFGDSAGISISPNSLYTNKVIQSNYEGANLHYSSEPGVYQNLSTANIWYKNTDWQEQTSFANISASISDGSFTCLAGCDGKYAVSVSNSLRAPFGVLMSQGIFKNGVLADDFSREMTGGPERALSFFNISSVDGYTNSTQDYIVATNSSTYTNLYTNFTSTVKALDAISSADGRFYHANESSGVTPGFLINGEINKVDTPFSIKFYGVGYDGGGHTFKIQTYNVNDAIWDNFTDTGTDFFDVGSLPLSPSVLSYQDFVFPTPRRNYVDANGKVKFRLNHTNSGAQAHDFEIDKVVLVDWLNSIPFPSYHEIDLVEGDIVTLSFKGDASADLVKDHVGITIRRIGN